jgi:hypothetical protein
VPEQLGFDQGRRQRGQGDLDEGPVGARGERVQAPRGGALAGAARALDQDRDLLRSDLGELGVEAPGGLARAQDVVVAASGDLAFETGTYSLTMSDPEGSPATERGQYVVVWRKQPDGAWKVAIDAPVSDPAS